MTEPRQPGAAEAPAAGLPEAAIWLRGNVVLQAELLHETCLHCTSPGDLEAGGQASMTRSAS